ncbi:MAG: IclR family transcriptional regulator [Deltaproteobacteria bacterium]|jgi:DNA-binding IclR family transcriptional regulator|nr:IclR family transcriptional regulator [Deltaproteobacteria bacterium]
MAQSEVDFKEPGRGPGGQGQGEPSDKSVQSIDRALDIVESLSTRQGGLSLTELAKNIGLPKSTTHRLLSTLVRRGYASKRDDGGYQIGLKLIEAVSYYVNSLELQTEARQQLARLTVELGLTAHLGVLEGDQVVYIERIDFLSGVKLYSQIGLRMHAYCSSLGKSLLAGLSGDELTQVMARCAFERFTPNTITTMAALRAELRKVRAMGYAVDNLEYSPNNRCVGAPIYDYRGETVAAISASGPPTVLPEGRIEEVAREVMAKARAISTNLGYGG